MNILENKLKSINIEKNINPNEKIIENDLIHEVKFSSSQEHEENNNNYMDIKNKLKIIFTFYASFGDRSNIQNLKSGKFHKLMLDSNIQSGNLTQKQLDLLFVSQNKHKPNMNFNTFLELIPKLSKV